MTKDLERFGWRFYFVAFLAVFALAYFVVPWRPVIEERLKNVLLSQGFKEASFTITDVGLQSATVENIKLGLNSPLSLSKITLHYSLRDLLTGKLNGLELHGLDFTLRQENSSWKIGGIEEWQTKAPSDPPLLLPVSREAIDAIPIKALRIEAGRLRVNANEWQMESPLDLSWLNDTQTTFSATSQGINFKSGSITGTTGRATLETASSPDKNQWEGRWNIQTIKLTGVKDDLPTLEGKGSLTAYADRIEVEGGLASEDNIYRLSFTINSNIASPNKSSLTILETTMPWMQGQVSAQQINIPLGERKPVQVNLNLQKVSIAALLQQLTGEEAIATGSISGTLPVTFSEKGNLSVQDATLQTNESGTIKMPPESIPGDNPQVAFVREVLQDFHYTLLSAKIENTPENQLSVTLAIEGQNPAVQGGRPVKINVHLKGDLLNLIEQNILWLYDPIKWMERGKHETY